MISTFKAYYLKRSISQLLEDTDGPNQPTIHEWQMAYNKVGGDGFSDPEEADIMELIDSHNEELSVDELIEIAAADEEQEQEVVLEVKDMTMKKLAEFFAQKVYAQIQQLERQCTMVQFLKSHLATPSPTPLVLDGDKSPVPVDSPMDVTLPVPPTSGVNSDTEDPSPTSFHAN
ncbi:hypothetical protein Y1Q_0014020 [Alligator mississippiensis]|uniref:Uncharacterized protein n=1 Tax=Alligator mississippiensis TaxID=8496 RepID=A0A151PDQ8_ALLMI|nr:hypothetical protein Y1Q_0014020 [Alligator mississippiensis]